MVVIFLFKTSGGNAFPLALFVKSLGISDDGLFGVKSVFDYRLVFASAEYHNIRFHNQFFTFQSVLVILLKIRNIVKITAPSHLDTFFFHRFGLNKCIVIAELFVEHVA